MGRRPVSVGEQAYSGGEKAAQPCPRPRVRNLGKNPSPGVRNARQNHAPTWQRWGQVPSTVAASQAKSSTSRNSALPPLFCPMLFLVRLSCAHNFFSRLGNSSSIETSTTASEPLPADWLHLHSLPCIPYFVSGCGPCLLLRVSLASIARRAHTALDRTGPDWTGVNT